MGTLYKFRDKDGEVKWGEIDDVNEPEYRDGEPIIPVVIEDGEIRKIKISEIIGRR